MSGLRAPSGGGNANNGGNAGSCALNGNNGPSNANGNWGAFLNFSNGVSLSERRNISRGDDETRSQEASVILIGKKAESKDPVRPRNNPFYKPNPMRRLKDHGENETLGNCRNAYEKYCEKKKKRKRIRAYEKDLDGNLAKTVEQIKSESWVPSPYTKKVIKEKKIRVLGKVPVKDHVIESASIFPYERYLYDKVTWHSPSLKPRMGTHGMLRLLRNDLYRHSQSEMFYNLSMDVHHYFPMMDHDILKDKMTRIIKPGKLLRFFYKVIDSYLQGAPLGIKIAQFFGQLYLADFDRLAMRFFDIGKDPEKMTLWTREYITIKIATASSPEDYRLLCRGPSYMAERFRKFVQQGLPHYYRFVDNMLFLHEDKAVLHIVKTLTVMILARDYHATINGDCNIRPTWMGIRMVGYVFYHDHVELGKGNKKALCRNVHRLFKNGLDEEQVRIKQASRFGYAKHADTVNLIKSIGMEKSLGKIIRNHRVKPPFEGMDSKQKVKFSSVCKMLNDANFGGGDFLGQENSLGRLRHNRL